jgi:hypothetical protein
MEREPIAASCIYAGRKRRIALALITALLLSSVLALPAVVQAEGRLPDGVPDLLNPRIRASWQSNLLGNLEGDPDFPVVVCLNVSDGAPAAVMMAIDARNGTSAWSLASDPVILIAVFAGPQTLTRPYYDQGFTDDGRPSGQYAKITRPDSAALSALLRWAAHLQHRVYI